MIYSKLEFLLTLRYNRILSYKLLLILDIGHKGEKSHKDSTNFQLDFLVTKPVTGLQCSYLSAMVKIR